MFQPFSKLEQRRDDSLVGGSGGEAHGAQFGLLLAGHSYALRDLKEENERGPQKDNAILVTAGVEEGLYTNIPEGESIQVFRDALNSSRLRPEPKLPTEFTITCNLFIFDSSFWSRIYMGWLETRILAA